MSKFTKIFFGSGLILIVYGYVCRLIDIYFFWESKYIGLVLLFIGIMGFLSERIKAKKKENKKTIFEKIGVGLIVFFLLVQIMFSIIITFTDAYRIAKSYLVNNQQLKTEVGDIIGFGLIPTGSIQKTTDSSGEYGNATINLIVKGKKKNKDVTIYVSKYANIPDWKVETVEP